MKKLNLRCSLTSPLSVDDFQKEVTFSDLPSGWSPISNLTEAQRILHCLKESVAPGFKVTFPEDYVEEEEESLGTILAILALFFGLVIFCGCFVPIAYHFQQEHYKKRLAETWEQRVKEAGEELSRTGGKTAGSSSAGSSGSSSAPSTGTTKGGKKKRKK